MRIPVNQSEVVLIHGDIMEKFSESLLHLMYPKYYISENQSLTFFTQGRPDRYGLI